MKNILTTLKLIDTFTLELDINKNDFIKNFKQHIKPTEFGFIPNILDLSSSKCKYIGNITLPHFEVRKPHKLFKMKNYATAKGTIKQKGNKLIINTEISLPNFQLLNLLIIIGIFIVGGIKLLFDIESNESKFLLIFGSTFGGIILLGGILTAFDNVKTLKNELYKDFKLISLIQNKHNKINTTN